MGDGTHHVFFYENSHRDATGGGKVSGTGKEDDDVLRPFRDWFSSLSDSDQICWAYGILPSNYDDLASTEIWYDVTYRLRVRLGEVTIGHLQQHYSMVKVLSQAFGGKPDAEPSKMSAAQAVRGLNEMFAV